MSRFFIVSSLVFACCLSIVSTDAQPKLYRISTSDSRIGFVVSKWKVFKEEGRFKQFEGTVRFDKQNPSNAQISISIKTASVDSRDTDRDNVIRSRDLFDVSRFPEMTFISTNVRRHNADTMLVTGDFTIRDVTKRITAPVRILGTTTARNVGSLVGFESEFVIGRTEYGLSAFSHLVGKDVQIQLQIGAIAK